MYLDTRELSSRDAYKLLIGSVVPRPIGWVSTVSADDVGNLAPFSFFMAATGNPPTVVLSTSFRDGEPKDTLRNVMEIPEFVLNVVSEDVQEAMNATSEEFPSDVDELMAAGLTAAPSSRVRPVRVAEAPINMECKVVQLVPVGDPTIGSTLIIGEVLAWHVRDDLFDAERMRIRLDQLRAVGRMAGDGYTRTRDQFDMIRPDPNYKGR
ncbi:MAG TPA: flavin reductase family protein [Chloroflexota bacterium]|nr:flavin reductase family protein [Chloroflexota bacterium]